MWDESNIEARHICGVSGHKSEETIKCYAKKVAPSKKREMADIISTKLGNPPPPKMAKESENLNDFEDWVPIENNKDDFVLVDILNQIENENAAVEKQAENNQALVPINPNMQPQNASNAIPPAIPGPSSAQPVIPVFNPTAGHQHVVNLNQAQHNPQMPKMYFPYSNVTINYNLGTPKQ